MRKLKTCWTQTKKQASRDGDRRGLPVPFSIDMGREVGIMGVQSGDSTGATAPVAKATQPRCTRTPSNMRETAQWVSARTKRKRS
jgi:hypothetical protein